MTNEEIQKVMEFIIKRQESFAENMVKADARMNRVDVAFVDLFNVVNETAKAQKGLAETRKEFSRIAEATHRSAEGYRRTLERADSYSRTLHQRGPERETAAKLTRKIK